MDIITYALCKKIANSAASGITNIRIDGLNLILTTQDGTELVMTFPTPKDGTSITNLSIDADNHLITSFSDGTTVDAGVVPTVKGDKGDKGDAGYSPIITVKENTDESYILTIQNETTTYDTPNLKGGSSSLKVLEGTLDAPIDLNSLDYNIYYIKGYFQKNDTSFLEQRKRVTTFTVTEDDATSNKTITYNIVENGLPTIVVIIYDNYGNYTETKYPLPLFALEDNEMQEEETNSTWGDLGSGEESTGDFTWGTL